MIRTLTIRELSRATLARQLLLRRSPMDAAEAVEHLVGLQTQVPSHHYTALWTRLAHFDAEDFSRRFEGREFVRLSLMRSTLHTVTARDCRALRPVLQAPQDRVLAANFRGQLSGVDLARLTARARELVEERPLSPGELGRALAAEWPDAEPRTLAMGARNLLALVQVPPRGLWRRGGAPRLTTAEHWLGAGPAAGDPASDSATGATPDALVMRYLAAFGPASVMDAQAWSGLTRLGEVVERRRRELVTFRDERGVELFDLPDAPRPGAGAEAPARFLPGFDNVFLGHKDRARVISDAAKERVWRGSQAFPVFLSDGFVRGTWRLDADAKRTRAVLILRPFGPLPRAERERLEQEGAALLAFHAPGAAHELRWEAEDAGDGG